MVVSRRHPDVLWVHNDSGNAAQLFALSTDGTLLGVYHFRGVHAVDWEDAALGRGPDPGTDYIYVADIGDNARVRSSVQIYRVPEPRVDRNVRPVEIDLTSVVALELEYEDGPHNAETLLSDPLTGDLYIGTKDSKDGVMQLFRYRFPHEQGVRSTLREVARYRFEGASSSDRLPTAGDISSDGRVIIVRTYNRAMLWKRDDGASVADAFAGTPCPVPIASERQGEALAFAPGRLAYLTLGEFAFQPIYRFDVITPTVPSH
jgi:hypothetical protein